MREFPDWLATTLASDAIEGCNVLPYNIAPLWPGRRVVGTARVVLMSQDDNLAVRELTLPMAKARGFSVP